MNPMFYSLIIEPNLSDADVLFMGGLFILVFVAGGVFWTYDLIKNRKRDS